MARIDERFEEARRAVDRLRQVPEDHAPPGDAPGITGAIASDARLLRFIVAFEAVWLAARQLMLDRYGPIQGTADGTIRACGDVGLLPPDQVAQLRGTAVFHAGLLERCRREGGEAPAAELPAHVTAVTAWLAAIEAAASTRPDREAVS